MQLLIELDMKQRSAILWVKEILDHTYGLELYIACLPRMLKTNKKQALQLIFSLLWK